MDALTALTSRVSVGRLVAPAPEGEQREALFQAALRAPDHGALKPWHFLTVEGEALVALGELMAECALADNPGLAAEKVEKARKNPLRAPLMVIAVARISESPKVPPVEQVLAVGAAVQNLMLAAHAQGFAAMWRTGELTYCRRFMDRLGLAANEQIVGFVYIGTAEGEARPPRAMVSAEYVRAWPDGM